jgi:hypothetical protein
MPSIQDQLWIKLNRWVQNFWFLSCNSGFEFFFSELCRLVVLCLWPMLWKSLVYPSWIQKGSTVILEVATTELWSDGLSVLRKCGRVWVTWLTWISVVAILFAVPVRLLVTQLTLDVTTYPAQRNITFFQTVSWPQTELFCFTNQK